MRYRERTLEGESLNKLIEEEKGTFIVERFSFVSPTRVWWTSDAPKQTCPYALAGWCTMLHDNEYDDAREWFNREYTGPEGKALLLICNEQQWLRLKGGKPVGLRDSLEWLDVPPPRK